MPFLHLPFFKCLWFRIILMPKWHILPPFRAILGSEGSQIPTRSQEKKEAQHSRVEAPGKDKTSKRVKSI